MCEYKFRDGKRCKEEALPNSNYCILHIYLPEDEESEEFERINELKEEKVREKIGKGDFNFEGAKLLEVDFSEMKIEGSEPIVLTFDDAVIRKDAWFNRAKIGGDAGFNRAEIGGDAGFDGAEIGGDARFDGAEIGGDARFDGAEIGGDAGFDVAEIGGDARFYRTEIGGDAGFKRAEIGGDAGFDGAEIGGDAGFDEAEIGGVAGFSLTEIKGGLNFKDAKFEITEAQEEACRTARKTLERIGDRVLADYHFYREMEAKRKQKYKTISLKPILKLIHKLRLEKLIRKHVGFLFSWDSVPGGDNENLINFLRYDFNINWAVNAEIRKSNEGKTIHISKDENSAEIMMDEKKRKALLKIGDSRTYDLIVIKENGKLNIYRFLEKERSVYWGFLELPVQYIFGYGVYPWRVIATWLLTVFSLAFVYWLGNGVEAANSLVEYIYFSVVTAATPGYGGYRPKPGFYQGMASFEAIFGTFMWAAFIATFARKYMR